MATYKPVLSIAQHAAQRAAPRHQVLEPLRESTKSLVRQQPQARRRVVVQALAHVAVPFFIRGIRWRPGNFGVLRVVNDDIVQLLYTIAMSYRDMEIVPSAPCGTRTARATPRSSAAAPSSS